MALSIQGLSIPQAPLTFNVTPRSLIELAKSTVPDSQRVQNEICSKVTVETATFDNVLLPLAYMQNHFMDNAQYLSLLQNVSADPEIPRAALEGVKLVEDADVRAACNADVYILMKSVMSKQPVFDAESQRYLEKKLQFYANNGLELGAGYQRDRLKELNIAIGDAVREFVDNLNNEKGGIWFAPAELEGLPESLLDGLEKSPNGTRLRITFKRPDVNAVLQNAHISSTRKAVFIGKENTSPQNMTVFKKVITLRDEMSRMLGFRNSLDKQLQNRMAKSQESLAMFLGNLKKELKEAASKDARKLIKMKKNDPRVTEDTQGSAGFFIWDTDYYQQQLLKNEYQVDHEKISEYFPSQVAIQEMLKIFEHLFGLIILELSETDEKAVSPSGDGADLRWHPEVRIFAVWNDDTEGGDFIGYLYTDIYPRDGKYSYNANFNLGLGYKDENRKRHHVSTALICNLSRPKETRPSLLKHRELWTLFHELGHGMHDLLVKSHFARFSAHQVSRDFGELPSQLLEHWCWIPSILSSMSLHYSHLSPEYAQAWLDENPAANGILPPKTIPSDVVESLVRAQKVNLALDTLRQISLSEFDINLHAPQTAQELQALEPGELYNRLRAEIEVPIYGPEILDQETGYAWGNGHLQTAHNVWGSESAYYGSQVYSADIYHTHFSADPMDKTVARRYRRQVLEPGASRDEMESLKAFLGREPDGRAFVRELGLGK